MKLAHKREELFAINGCLDIEVETVLKFAFGNLTALELNKVHAGCIEARHDTEECTGAVRDIYHYTCAVGTRIDFRLFSNADEACVVVVAVLDCRF